MKAILKFNLPEESGEYRAAIDGWRWRCVCEGLDEELRKGVKHGDAPESVKKELENVRLWLRGFMDDYNLTFEEN